MKKIHVEIHTVGWRGDEAASTEDASVLVAEHLVVNGEEIHPFGWQILADSSFLTLAVRLTPAGEAVDSLGSATDSVREIHDRATAMELHAWAGQFAPDDYLWGTTGDRLLLPITTLSFVQRDVAERAAAA